MAVTLRDIAKHVNLSHATVSFVLNDRRDVAIPETTRQRVMEAAKELGYHPNRAARALVMGRTRVIGIWAPPLSSRYLQSLFQGLTDKFRLAGLDSLYCRHSPDFSGQAFEWPVDGIIWIDAPTETQPAAFTGGVPVVLIGSRPLDNLDCVNIDVASGTVESIMHLLELGRTRIVCVSGEASEEEGSITDTYRRIMGSAGHAARSLSVRKGTLRQMWKEILDYLAAEDKVDAVFCTSDELAGVTRRALADLNLAVPADTALVGFEYSEECEFLVPSLSAVEIPVDRVVEIAGDLMISRMTNPSGPPRIETVLTSLRIQESSTPQAKRWLDGGASIL